MAATEEAEPAERHAALAREYDDCYGAGAQAPLGAIAAYGDQVAAETAASGDESLAQALSEADELYAAEQSEGRRPAIDESTVSTPNFENSKVVHVRLNERDYDALTALAGDREVHISDVVRAAIAQYLRPGTTDKTATRRGAS